MNDNFSNINNPENNDSFPDFEQFTSSFNESKNNFESNNSENNNNFNNNDNNNFENNNNFDNNTDSFNPFANIDMNTIFKMKNIMEKMNNKKNDPRANLLLSLKPYLKDSRKQKVDQYINIFNISSVIESINSTGGDNNK